MSAGDAGGGARADEIAARRNAKIAIMLCSLLSDNKPDDPGAREELLALAAEPLIARQLALIVGLDDTLRARFADLLETAKTTLRNTGGAPSNPAADVAGVDAWLSAADEHFRVR